MANVKINKETPSEQLIANAAQEVKITDARGRKITLRKPGVLAQYRLIEAVGPDTARNTVYMNMTLPLIYVSDIDGAIVPAPTTKAQVEALITRLDEDGINAVVLGVNENFGVSDPEADRETLKNA